MMAPRQWAAASAFGFLMAPLSSWAEPFDAGKLWVNAGFYSAHFNSSKSLRNANPGLGVEYPINEVWRLTAGAFHNSVRHQSRYVGAYYLPLEWKGARFGVVAGAFDGYPRYRGGGWFPALLPVVAIEGQNWGLNIAFIPTIKDRLDGAISFQLKYRFGAGS